MRIYIIKLIIILAISSCQNFEETTSENLVKYLQQSEITITHIVEYREKDEVKIKFINSNEDIKVEIYAGTRIRPSRELNISIENFEEIKNGLKCLVKNHSADERPTTEILNEYIIELYFKKMNLFDLKGNCGFGGLLRDKLNYPSILDVRVEKF